VGSEETSDVALLPIKPKFANAIMDGSKRVEFRKVKFQRNVRHVVVYASSPISMVIGYFTVAGIDEGSPAELWRKYEAVGGIAEDEFRKYYRSAGSAIAINVGEVKTLSKPVRLASLKRNLTAPQSFAYLDAAIMGKLRQQENEREL